MRCEASVLHLDLDAFFASVEQRDKPSLRGKPVIVGGLGGRGVVSTASYEARTFGVHSAMPMHQARRLCPHGAFLTGRFAAYRAASTLVMDRLRELSPLVEPLSIDEAFVDLAAAQGQDRTVAGVRGIAQQLKDDVWELTGGLRASVGVGSSKFMAKLATELGKPDGLYVVEPGTEADLIAPMSVGVIPGVGPVTREKLNRLGVETIADLREVSDKEMVRELGTAAAASLGQLVWARDDRRVNAERETKSISVEDTFEHDMADRALLRPHVERHARLVAQRLQASGLFARTVQLKVKFADFTTWTRSRTLAGATDRFEVITALAGDLLAGVDVSPGVRLIGVGVAGLASIAQEQLFDVHPTHHRACGHPVTVVGRPTATVDASDEPDAAASTGGRPPSADGSDDVQVTPHHPALGGGHQEQVVERRRVPNWSPGADVVHAEHGPGWIWGAGLGRVTVRFETADTGPGPVRTFSITDPELSLFDPY